jgi:rhodanese-related sulfurtransferase
MDFQTIDRTELERKLSSYRVDNRDRETGLALVNVLEPEMFDEKHIPNYVNIPGDNVDQFEQRFSKDKNIVVYCASKECDASPRAAQALAERGFRHVFDYEGGVADWEKGSQPLAGRAATANSTPS